MKKIYFICLSLTLFSLFVYSAYADPDYAEHYQAINDTGENIHIKIVANNTKHMGPQAVPPGTPYVTDQYLDYHKPSIPKEVYYYSTPGIENYWDISYSPAEQSSPPYLEYEITNGECSLTSSDTFDGSMTNIEIYPTQAIIRTPTKVCSFDFNLVKYE